MNFFFKGNLNFRKKYFYASYLFDAFFCFFYVLKQFDYFKFKEIKDKRNEFSVYFIIFIRFFFYLIETIFRYISYFFKGNLFFFKILFEKIFLIFSMFPIKIKVRKKCLINDFYNSFSTKILISSTAFFVLYLTILIFFIYLYLKGINSSSVFFDISLFPSFSSPNIKTFGEHLLIKDFIEIYDFMEEYLDNNKLNTEKYTPVAYYSKEKSLIRNFVIDTDIFYVCQALQRTISEELFEFFDDSLRDDVYKLETPENIEQYNKIVWRNRISVLNICVADKIDIFFKKNNITEKAFIKMIEAEIESLNKEKNCNLDMEYFTRFYKRFKKEIMLENYLEFEKLETYFNYNFNYNLINNIEKFAGIYLTEKFNLSFIFNSKLVSKFYFLISIIYLINILHTFIAFLSLGYDYLLKKLTQKNIFILYFISSTTLQLFFKILFIYFFW